MGRLLGPNGSGKSQFLQLIAEIVQSAWHAHAPDEEREPANASVQFELEYSLTLHDGAEAYVRLRRNSKTKPRKSVEMHSREGEEWIAIKPGHERYGARLPSLVVGYTSGDNETLSLPFFVSRAGYASEVSGSALKEPKPVKNNRLLLIDYGTHLEVLVANLLLGTEQVQRAILEHAKLDRLASCRCVIQLNHIKSMRSRKRPGIQLTKELEDSVDAMRRSATCWHFDEATHRYTFDYFVDTACSDAFRTFFLSAADLYLAFHKLALLNDLAIPKPTRTRLGREIENRRFASRLPEPQDEDKVFRFEQVRLHRADGDQSVPLDYVSLSDGEHQQAQIFGVFSMIVDRNTLFVLDEPESHFNPQWRVQFVKRLLGLPAARGHQEVLLTSHAPFVPSDISRDHVLIFSKDDNGVHVKKPEIETYGATFDRILEHCFGVKPPISAVARDEINELMESNDVKKIREAMDRLGSSVQKAILADRLGQLEAKED